MPENDKALCRMEAIGSQRKTNEKKWLTYEHKRDSVETRKLVVRHRQGFRRKYNQGNITPDDTETRTRTLRVEQ